MGAPRLCCGWLIAPSCHASFVTRRQMGSQLLLHRRTARWQPSVAFSNASRLFDSSRAQHRSHHPPAVTVACLGNGTGAHSPALWMAFIVLNTVVCCKEELAMSERTVDQQVLPGRPKSYPKISALQRRNRASMSSELSSSHICLLSGYEEAHVPSMLIYLPKTCRWEASGSFQPSSTATGDPFVICEALLLSCLRSRRTSFLLMQLYCSLATAAAHVQQDLRIFGAQNRPLLLSSQAVRPACAACAL